MTATRCLSAACLVAFTTICLPAEKLIAQALYGNRSSPPIEMVVNGGTHEERWRSSHFGIFDPVGLRAGEQIPITLILPGSMVNYPVGIAPLDGGKIVAAQNLNVDSDRTAAFSFRGGTTPGLYRVLVTIASEQYQLQLYVARSQDLEGCPPAP